MAAAVCRVCGADYTPAKRQILKRDWICPPCQRTYSRAWRARRKLYGPAPRVPGTVLRTCVCGKEFRARLSPSCVRRGEGKYCSKPCSARNRRLGRRSNNWRGGRQIVASGHVIVYMPGHPQARPDGYALEHRVVMAGVLGRTLARSEVVHHLNGVATDNRPENLTVLQTQSEHMRLHMARERKRAREGKRHYSQNARWLRMASIFSRRGITLDQYHSLYECQDFSCYLCLACKPLHLDHDHVTGRARRLLCWQCNFGIGQLRDDPRLLRLAAAYIEKYTATPRPSRNL